jgi:hypothetical protein
MTTKGHKQRMRYAMVPLTNAGGEGKTWVSMLIHAIFNLLNEPLIVADADQGNRAARVILGEVHLIDISKEAETSSAELVAQVDGGKSLLIDCGANALASSVNFNNALAETAVKLREDGYKTYGLCVVSANKPGAAAALKRIASRFSPFFEMMWVFNDRDGSNNVPEGFAADITVQNLDPGFVTLIHTFGGLASVVLRGIKGYGHSSDYIKAYLWRFADQEGIRKLFGDTQIDGLRPLLDHPFKRVDPMRIDKPETDEEYLETVWKAKTLRIVWPSLGDVDAMIQSLQDFRKT